MWAKSASRLCECWAPRRTPPPDTIRRTSGMRRLAAHHEPQLRRLVHDLVEGDAREVRELELHDGAQPRQRGADATADEAALGQRRVADAVGAVAVVEALGRAEQAAHAADVLADHDHVGVCGELEVECLLDRGDEPEAPVARRRARRVAPVRAEDRRQQVVDARILVGERGLDRRLDLGLDVGSDRGDARRRRARPRRAEAASSRGSGSFGSHSSTTAGSRTSGRFARIECCIRRNVFISRNDGPPPARASSSARGDGVLDRERGRCRRRPRPASRSPRPGRRDPRPRAACASRPRARTGCSRR